MGTGGSAEAVPCQSSQGLEDPNLRSCPDPRVSKGSPVMNGRAALQMSRRV